jgi:hypothetical protein
MEPKLRELMQTLGDPPRHVTAQAVRHQVVRRRRRFTIIAAAAAAAVLAAVIPALAGAYSGLAHSGNGSPGSSYLTPMPDGNGSVYHDAAGWMIDIPPGWHVLSFRSSKDGATAAGAQISNVPLPAPALMPGFPVQASGETLPAHGVSLVIATDTDPKVCRPGPHPSPAGGSNYCQRSYASPPVSFKDMNLSSSLGGTPVTSFLWMKAGGTTLSLTAKFGTSAFSDRWVTPVSTMLASLRTAPSHAGPRRPATSPMPLVTGLTLPAAEAKIRSGITSLRFTIQHAEDTIPAGRVIAQRPVNGSRVSSGSAILLTVSSGENIPPCTAPVPSASSTVSLTTQAGPPYFTQNCYYARSGQPVTIKLTNRVLTLGSKQPLTDKLIISPISQPAFWPIPGHPGIGAGSTKHAVFVSPPVTAPRTEAFTIRPLAPGTYLVQLMNYGLESTVRLIVQ